MSYVVKLENVARKQLESLPSKVQSRILKALVELEQEPRSRQVKKLKGSGFWRFRVGDYRIIYSIQDRELVVTVIRIGNRRDVYE